MISNIQRKEVDTMKLRGLRKITPYVAGEQPAQEGIIKLNTNENAYSPSPKVVEAMKNFDANSLRKYSTLDQAELTQALADQLDLQPEQIIIGNGSDDILSMAFLAFFNDASPVIFPNLTYGFYKVWADLYHVPYKEIPLTADFTIDSQDYLVENGGIILANPNAPTGIYKSLDELEIILQANEEVVVVIDEAYINFGGKSALSLLDKYKNLFITRTFSKDAALAGLRVGYGIGHPDLIQLMKAIKNSINPYSVDLLAENLALAAVRDWKYYENTAQSIQDVRDQFAKQIKKLGFEVLPSHTNFLLVKPTKISAEKLFSYLKENRIYVRYFPKVNKIKDYLRISIGRADEMEQVLACIVKCMSQTIKNE